MASSSYGVSPLPFTYVAHFLGIVSVIFVFIWTIGYRGGIDFNSATVSLIFNVHPVLMLIAFVFLSSEAILAYKTLPGSKPFRKRVHLSIQLVALVLGIVGIIAAVKYHDLSGIDNYYSLHSWLGLITISLFGLQWLLGFITFFFPGLAPSVRSAALPWHVFAGLFIYGLSIATSELGFLEKLTFLQTGGSIGRFSTEALFVNSLGIIIAVLAAFVFIAAIIPVEHPAEEGYERIE